MELPVISTKTDLTLDEAKREYIDLKKLLKAETFPDNGTGWSSWVLDKIETRMMFLKTLIADTICNEEKKHE